MGYWKYRAVAIVPASQLAAFNTVLERHGYGATCLVASERTEVVDAGAASEAAPTHYVCATLADAGFMAAIKRALKAANDAVPVQSAGTLAPLMAMTSAKPTAITAVLAAAGKKLNHPSVKKEPAL